MTVARRRLLQLGLASATTGLSLLPAESWARGKHHAAAAHSSALHKASFHKSSGHHATHGHHGVARQTLHGHAHGHGDPGDAHLIQQAEIRLGDQPRRAKFHNLHTDEKLDAVYWENGSYVPDALHAVNHVLRDFRTGDVHMMDPGLLDLLTALSAKTESNSPFYVISGYRSPQTNAMLRNEGGQGTGVAKKSLHLQGQAIDIRLADVQLSHLHNAALSLGRGGVGYYPTSDFVHVDVGAVRRWSGA
jgi:uncharacterized protein YcbK (DUF882 family)